MKTTFTILLLLFTFILSNSCSQKNQTINRESEQLSEETIEKPANKEETPYEKPREFLTEIKEVPVRDSILLDQEQLDTFIKYKSRAITEVEYQQYSIADFMFAPRYSESIFLLDSVNSPDKDYFIRFFVLQESRRVTAWMANYDISDGHYIDGRRIYNKHRPYYYSDEEDFFYSILDLPENKMEVFRPSGFFGEVSIPVVIYPEGTFEEFPGYPMNHEGYYAISSCSSIGLEGKIPANERWSLLSFSHSENKIERRSVVTQNFHADDIGSVITLFYDRFVPQDHDRFYFNIAFGGLYPETDIPLLETEEESMNDNLEIEQLLFTALKEQDDEYFADADIRIDQLHSYTHEDKKYWFAHVSRGKENNMYPCIVGISPKMEVTVLAPVCGYSYYLFQIDSGLMIYTESTSCGEGAVCDSYVYLLEYDSFILLYEGGKVCD